MKRSRIINYICSFTISTIILGHYSLHFNQTAHAFFEDHLRYKLLNYWYPMLSEPSPEKRFEASRAFLTYPELSLPLLRNSIMNQDSENVSRQIAMLIGILGDSTDVPPMLKIWRGFGIDENSSIWLGAMRRLYWKSRGAVLITPILKSITINFDENRAENETEKKAVNIFFKIANPSITPIFIKVSSNFWLTITDENIPSKYFWIPAGGRIESHMKTFIYPSYKTDMIRLDFRIWEVGVPETILHHTEKFSFPFK